MKIQQLLVWLSVRFSRIFIVLSILLIYISYKGNIDANNLPLIIFASAILIIALTCYFNTRDDIIYREMFNIDDDEDELLYTRGKSMWFCIFIGSAFIFIFSSVTVNSIFTKPETTIIINGQKIESFDIINPFDDHIETQK